jgi:hypothetical protein
MSKNLIPAQDPSLCATASHRDIIILLHSYLQLYNSHRSCFIHIYINHNILYTRTAQGLECDSSVAHGMVVEFIQHVTAVNTVILSCHNHDGWIHLALGSIYYLCICIRQKMNTIKAATPRYQQ